MTESMAISYAKRWYDFHPDSEFRSVREVVLHAKKVINSSVFERSTQDLCVNLMLNFECRFDEISIEDRDGLVLKIDCLKIKKAI